MAVNVEPYVFLRVVVGSHAFGLATETSDEDRRGIYLPSADWHWSLAKPPEQVESIIDGIDVVDWEIEKFLTQALKGNPTILETLWSPIVLHSDALGDELRAMRTAFLSRAIGGTFSGYAKSQFHKMQSSVARGEGFKAKHAMHLIRLLHSGIYACQHGEILVDVGEHRDELMAIRHGRMTFADVFRRTEELTAQFEAAFAESSLPEKPDSERVNQFLIRARRSRV